MFIIEMEQLIIVLIIMALLNNSDGQCVNCNDGEQPASYMMCDFICTVHADTKYVAMAVRFGRGIANQLVTESHDIIHATYNSSHHNSMQE